MESGFLQIFVNALYILVLINPISKVSVLFMLSSENHRTAFRDVTTKSSMVAAGILIGAMIFGNFLLSKVFRIEMHSLNLAGGVVLFWMGFNALRKGVFFEQDTRAKFEDMALVPLACPMIAGPATIAACIALRGGVGLWSSIISVILAVSINHGIMSLSSLIGQKLTQFNIMGALIRITGLIVMAIGTEMALNGITAWRAVATP